MPDLGLDYHCADSLSFKQEPLQFGVRGELLGILTLPSSPEVSKRELPVFVFLNAGLVHRPGPQRLYARLAWELAELGFPSLRVDLSGVGDSPVRSGLTNEQSVSSDFGEITKIIASRLGNVPLVLVGLCSGADNAIRCTIREQRVIGMILLDPFCFSDQGFRIRALVGSLKDWATHPFYNFEIFRQRVGKFLGGKRRVHPLSLRDVPSRKQMRDAYELIRQREGKILSVYTRYALLYYNKLNQLNRAFKIEGYQTFCEEKFWPDVDHTYPLEINRLRLIETVKKWARAFLEDAR